MKTFKQIFEEYGDLDHFESMPADFLHHVTKEAVRRSGYGHVKNEGSSSRWFAGHSMAPDHEERLTKNLSELGWQKRETGYKHPTGATIHVPTNYPGALTIYPKAD